MDEEDKRAVRANTGGPQNTLSHRFKLGLCRMNIRHFKAHMMLTTLRIFRQKACNALIAGQRLNQFNLRPIMRPFNWRIDKADLHPLILQIKGRVNMRRPHHIAPKDDAGLYRGRCHANMVQTTEFH